MARIKDQPPSSPLWPWGGPGEVRSRLVDPTQFDRKARKPAKGDPKNPALPSSALMDFIGPAHTSEDVRLPPPPMPEGMDAPLAAFEHQPALLAMLARARDPQQLLERGMARLQASSERMERLKALLGREAQMVKLLRRFGEEVTEIRRQMQEAQKDEGY